ncbi:MAG: sigma 54-interacting transcriptional regulator [Myxococcota bacterium]
MVAVGQLGLEQLQSIDEPAILISTDYRVLAANEAYRARFPGMIEPGVSRCHGVSHGYDNPCDQHGESCPLKKAGVSKRTERVFHVHHGPEGLEHVDIKLEPVFDARGDLAGFIEVIKPIEIAQAEPAIGFVGRSTAFSEMLGLLQRGASSEVPILLLGESGSGKELAARAVHDSSPRAEGPFVPVECSGLNDALFESELFGHVRGAFTGATAPKPGLIEASVGGTLFLDEIGDVPLSMQVKLLRLLESGTFRRVGDVAPQRADFRLVCATHRDLDRLVQEGAFRQDLYFRINAFPIPMPSLRDRPDDLDLLSASLLEGSGKRLSSGALARLKAYPFPGNVRELRNILERATLLADGEFLFEEHLPDHVRGAIHTEGSAEAVGPPPGWPTAIVPLEEAIAHYLRWAEGQHRGDRVALAKRLGLSERTLYRRLRSAAMADDSVSDD